MTAALDFLKRYVAQTPFDEESYKKALAESTEFTPTAGTYRAAIGSQFQDLFNRPATSTDIAYYKDRLKQFGITNPREMASTVAESLYLTPEFERKAPLTPEEQTMSAYYGMPVRNELGEKTGRYASKAGDIEYKGLNYFS